MTKRQLYILGMIKEGIPLNEIERSLNLSVSELSQELKSIREYGYNLKGYYYSDGNIILKPNKSLETQCPSSFRLNVKGKVLKVIFISDLHIGSIFDNPEYLKIVYDYAKEHDIHIVINCGDIIDNVYPDNIQQLRSNTVHKQLLRLLRVYPRLNDIITLNLYGNHDYKSILDEGFDPARFIANHRYDLVSLGYGQSVINVKDDKIGVIHNLNRRREQLLQSSVTYKGHSHKSKNSFKDEKIIYVPTLSDSSTNNYEFKPLTCFLESEFIFYDKLVERINQRQLAIIGNEIRLANEDALVLRHRPPQ